MFHVLLLPMARYFIELAYNGSAYHGWQRQPNGISVQETLENALALILGLPGISLTGAGRTDTGVHARQMFAHFDVEKPFSVAPEILPYRLNRFLPPDIVVYSVKPVHADAHARFDAVSRRYEYHITRKKNPFLTGYAWELHRTLDTAALEKAAEMIGGFTDFSAFSKAHAAHKTPFCQVSDSHWEFRGDLWIYHIAADRFLRNMVRAITGTLIEISEGKLPLDDLPQLVASGDRKLAGESAPAHGLYLVEVAYPEGYFGE